LISSIDRVGRNTDAEGFYRHRIAASPGAIGGTVSEDRSRAGGRGVRGSVKFFETYPGPYVPRPIEFTVHQAETGLRQLAAAEKVSQALLRRTVVPANSRAHRPGRAV